MSGRIFAVLLLALATAFQAPPAAANPYQNNRNKCYNHESSPSVAIQACTWILNNSVSNFTHHYNSCKSMIDVKASQVAGRDLIRWRTCNYIYSGPKSTQDFKNNVNSSRAAYFERRADAYQKIGKHREAVSDYTEQIKLNFALIEGRYVGIQNLNLLFAYRDRGYAHYDLNEMEKALADFNSALSYVRELKSNHAKYRSHL